MVQEPVPGSQSWSRAHFGAWCIVSSPLYLGFDLFDQALMNSVLDIIGNRGDRSKPQAPALRP